MSKPFAWTNPLLVACAIAGVAISQGSAAQSPPTTPAGHPDAAPKSATPLSAEDEKKTLYALGVLLSRNLEAFSLTPSEFATVSKGFADGYHHKAILTDAETQIPQVQSLESARQRRAGDAYLAKAAAAPGATKTASGMVFQSVKEGAGPNPTRTDRVKVNYEGRLIDGTVFDSSAMHGNQPAMFPLTGVIACWTEALQRMKAGGKARVVCPAAIAYGERAIPPKIPRGSTLDFNIELLEILPPIQPGGAAGPGVPPAPNTTPPPATPGAPAKPGAPPPTT